MGKRSRAVRRLAAGAAALMLGAWCSSCTEIQMALQPIIETGAGNFYNQTATRRGNILIGFVNNTSARAVFAFGGYDPNDEDTTPDFGTLRLNGNNSSNQITQPCRRFFTVGGATLVSLVQKRGLDVTDPPALISGQVNFSTAPANDPLATQPTEGTAEPIFVDIGKEYLCDGLLLFSFNEDSMAPGGFRIDFTFVPQ